MRFRRAGEDMASVVGRRGARVGMVVGSIRGKVGKVGKGGPKEETSGGGDGKKQKQDGRRDSEKDVEHRCGQPRGKEIEREKWGAPGST